MAQTDILLPEEEGVAVGVAGEPQARVVVADGPNFFNCFHEVRSVMQAIEVERKLGIFDGLCSWDWTEKWEGESRGLGAPCSTAKANGWDPGTGK